MENQNLILSRVKTFSWNILWVAVASILVFLQDPESLNELGLPEGVILILGLVFSQISKYWNNKQKLLGKTFFGRIIK